MIQPDSIDLEPNHVLDLNAPKGAKWEIESGSLAVFLCELARENARHPLLTLKAGDLVPALPHRTNAKYGIRAVALEPVRLRFFDHEQSSAALSADPERESTRQLEAIQNVTVAIPLFEEAQSDVTTSSRVDEQTLTLEAGQTFRAPRNSPCWVRVENGEALFMGMPDAVVTNAFGAVPAVSRFWLVAKTPLQLRKIAALDVQDFGPDRRSALREYFSHFLESISEQAAEQQEKRFRDREIQINNRLNSSTERIGQIQDPALSAIPADWPALSKACAEIGRYQGITFRPPLAIDETTGEDLLQSIARASNVRARRVVLDGEWFREAATPLLVFEKSGEHAALSPVALIPKQSGGYEKVNPDGSRGALDTAQRARLAEVAYVFYTPLPAGAVTIQSLLQLMWQTSKRGIAAIFLYALAVSFLSLALPEANKQLIENIIPAGDRTQLFHLGAGLFAIVCSIALFAMVQGLATLRLNSQIDHAIQSGLMDRVLRLSTRFFRKFSTGDLALRVMAMQQIQALVGAATIKALLSSLVSVLTLIVLFRYSPTLALAGVALGVVSYAVTIWSCVRMYAVGSALLETRGSNFGLVVELIAGISKLRVAGAERRAFAFWTERYATEKEQSNRQREIQDGMELALGTLGTLSLFVILALGAPLLTAQPQAMSVGEFLAFYFAFGQFLAGVTGICQHAQALVGAMNLWRRAEPVLREEPETNPAATDPGLLRGAIEIDRVSFRYNEKGPRILDKISLSIQPGQFVALVGPSGCGKSTLLRLLLGFEKSESGSLYYDGQDLSGLDLGALRRQIGVVLQNGRISGGTIFENIQAGGILSRDQALEAATLAAFDKDVEQMPMGLHTVLSEGGETLSGGQRQRLLIARALAHKPRIIYMDEATSALDNETQRTVTQSMDRLKATRIVIAHRLSTIRNADYIYVMDRGRIIQHGAFDDLVKCEGLFKRLVQRQMA